MLFNVVDHLEQYRDLPSGRDRQRGRKKWRACLYIDMPRHFHVVFGVHVLKLKVNVVSNIATG